jgi:hypothetical protein
MSVEVLAAIWGGIAGGVTGGLSSLLVLLIGRWLRRRGEIRCEFSDWFFAYLMRSTDSTDDLNEPSNTPVAPISINPDTVSDLAGAKYSFTVDLFNEKEVGLALRDVRVVFLYKGALMFSNRPFDTDRLDRSAGGAASSEIGSIYLPTRELVRIRMEGRPTSELAKSRLYSGCDEVRLVAVREDSTPFERRITTRLVTSMLQQSD